MPNLLSKNLKQVVKHALQI